MTEQEYKDAMDAAAKEQDIQEYFRLMAKLQTMKEENYDG